MNEIYTRPCLLTQWAETSNIQTFASIPSLLYKSAGDIHGYKTVGICVSLPNYLSTCIVLRRSIKLCAVWRYFPPPPTPTDKRRKMEIFFKKEEGTISIFLWDCTTCSGEQQMAKHPRRLWHTVTVWYNRMEAGRQAGWLLLRFQVWQNLLFEKLRGDSIV
jgi:hypothetical protein